MAENTVDYSGLTTKAQMLLTDLMALSDKDGVLYKKELQSFVNFFSTTSGVDFKGKLLIADTPVDGWYFAGESGTYTNAGSLVVDVSDNIAIIIVSNSVTTFEKVDIPVTISIDAVPTDGSTNAVQSGGTFDVINVLPQKTENSFETTKSRVTVKDVSDDVGYLNVANGLLVSVPGGNFRSTDFFDIQKGLKYNIRIQNNANVAAVYYYDELENFISVQEPDTSSLIDVDLIIPANAFKFKFSYNIAIDIFELSKYIYTIGEVVDVTARNFVGDLEKLSITVNEGYILNDSLTVYPSVAWNYAIIDLTTETRQLYLDAGGNVANTTISLAVYADAGGNILGTQGDFDSPDRPTSRKLKLVPPDGATQVYVVGSKASTTLYGKLAVFAEVLDVNKTIAKASRFYNAYGDSITQGVGATDFFSYSDWYFKLANLSRYLKSGVSSSRVIKSDAGTSTNLVLYNKTKLLTDFTGLITVAIGVNDYLNQNPLGVARTSIKATLSSLNGIETYDAGYTFADGFRFTMETLKNANPDATIFCLLPINSNTEWNGSDATYPILLQDYRDVQIEICKYLGIEVIEMQYCGISPSNLPLYMPDGLHPNDNGHELMAKYMLKEINY